MKLLNRQNVFEEHAGYLIHRPRNDKYMYNKMKFSVHT